MANKKRLIDANVLMEHLARCIEEEKGLSRAILVAVKCFVVQMSPVDAVEVVRCKDCKHKGWIQEACHGKSVDYCHIWDSFINDSGKDFCSYGERRTDG